MSETRYLDFEDAMEFLSMDEDRLMDLVEDNEIRAFRVDREMKFKESDLKAVSSRLGSDAAEAAPAAEAVAPLGEAEISLEDEEDVVSLEEVDDLEVDLAAPAEEAEEVALLEDEPVAEAIPDVEEEVVELVDVADSDSGLVELGEDDGTVVMGGDDAQEEVAEVELVEDASATLQIEDSDMLESGGVEVDLDGAEETAVPELEGDITDVSAAADEGDATEVVLDAGASDGLGTEEIVFEDEDLAIGGLEDDASGTQEVTVQEGIIGEDELTIQDSDVEEESSEEAALEEDDEDDDFAPPAGSRRMSARRSARLDSAAFAGAAAAAPGRSPIMSLALAVTALVMIYPALLFAHLATKGLTHGKESFTTADVSGKGAPVIEKPFVLEMFSWVKSSLAHGDWWGDPSFSAAPVAAPAAEAPASEEAAPAAEGGAAAGEEEAAE